jgi:hypothetical protein
MQGTSEESIIIPHIGGVETETLLILSKISEQKEFLNYILKKYGSEKP